MFKKFLVIFITFFLITDNLFAEEKSIKGYFEFNIQGKIVIREAIYKDLLVRKDPLNESKCPSVPDVLGSIINYKGLDVFYYAYDSHGRCIPCNEGQKGKCEDPRAVYVASYVEGLRFNHEIGRMKSLLEEYKLDNKLILSEDLKIYLSPTESLKLQKMYWKKSYNFCEDMEKDISSKLYQTMGKIDCSNITKGFNYNIQVVQYSDILKLNLTKVSLTKKLTNQEHIKIAEQLLKTYSRLAKDDSSWSYRNSEVEKNDIKTLVSLIDTSIEYNVHTRK
jgi:hypothetical protein